MSNAERQYADIINLPHHVSKKRPQMNLIDRAASFAAKMGVDTSDSHFGYFDLEQLREAERILTLVQDKRPVISKKGRLRFEG